MSGSDSESGSAPGRREVAYRLFAAEFDDAELSYSESDEERAPNYVVTPTGARVNRLFAVGVLTELEDVNPEMVRGRIVDPTGAFVTYAGQYQPDELAFLERIEPPAFLAVSGKARTYEPEDGDRIYTSVRPEAVSEVDGETRDRWVVTAAERTRERIGVIASAIESGMVGDQLRAALVDAGVDDRLADGVALALDHYGTTPAYLAALGTLAADAVRVVAGEREEVGELELAPGEGAGDASELATLDLTDAPTPETAAAAAGVTGEGTDPTEDPDHDAEPEPSVEDGPSIEAKTGADAAPETEADSQADTETEPAATEPEPTSEGDEEADAVPEDFDPGEFELDEEERREVEDEYGTEFSTADEVEPADIEPDAPDDSEIGIEGDIEPDPDPEAESDPEAETPAGDAEDESASDDGDAVEAEDPDSDSDLDLEDAVMEAMERLDDGDGADEDALVETIAEERGADPDAVSEAIQDALMSGRCYEPADGVLKPI